MVFTIPNEDDYIPNSTIELFNKLGKLNNLSFHQGNALQEYEKLRQKNSDLAIEMPSGEGKTLVGGLIGEFNRIKKKWRVAYCCATRQLAAQTSELLQQYGIKSVLLVGKEISFPACDVREYRKATAIAVTTYSHIFNINPEIKDAQLIIFDDAHATEYAINGLWTFEINKKDNKDTFDTLYSILKSSISTNIQDKIETGINDPLNNGIDIIPQMLWIKKEDQIRSYLDTTAGDNDWKFSWSKIRSILHACQIYISSSRIVIKPPIAPNKLHFPFSEAKERVYMSATLGAKGDIERTFGIDEVERISKLSQGAHRVLGNRLILFPEDHFGEEDINSVIIETIKMQNKVLLLFPTYSYVETIKNFLEDQLPQYKIFLSKDIEDSLENFRKCPKAILLLAGRYEGIDLKDDDCHLEIFYDVPIAVGVSEQFLQSRLRATEVLKSRLSSRLTQGLGRCTRGNQDFSVVLFLGKQIGEYLYKNDFRMSLPPEIDAEIEFGFAQNKDIRDLQSWQTSIRDFISHGSSWLPAENYIKKLTDKKEKERADRKYDTSLEECAENEIKFQYHLINREYEKANKEAHQILNNVARNPNLNGYRAWWNYLLSCVASLQKDDNKAKEYIINSLSASTNKTWLDKDLLLIERTSATGYDDEIEAQLNLIFEKIISYGDRDRKFEKDYKELISGLSQKKAEIYEQSIKKLGDFMGVYSYRPTGKGTPDGVWSHQNKWIAFEAKTDIKDPTEEIPLDDVRQAAFHGKWIKDNLHVNVDYDIPTCVICEKTYIEKFETHASDNLFLIAPNALLEQAKKYGDLLREVIGKNKYSNEKEAKELLGSLVVEQKFTFKDFYKWLTSVDLKSTVR